MRRWVFAVFTIQAAFAQQAKRPAITSPEVQSDGQVVVRLWAPDAKKVQLSGDWMGPQPALSLVQADDGVWSAKFGPLPPNIYTYGFLVDGVRTDDPSCRCGLTIARRWAASRFIIPGAKPQPWEERKVPTGTLHEETFYSTQQQRSRRYMVYTPPGYQSSARRYPALLLMPGTPGDHDDWTRGGGFAERIFDNLIAAGSMRPAIVVMNASDVLTKGGTRADNLRELEPLLVNELIPEVKRKYEVERRPEFWAIAGISLGGEAAMTIGLRHPELFRSIGSMGGSILEPELEDRFGKALAAPEALKRDYKLIWLRCGSGDVFLPGNKAFSSKLQSLGIPHEFPAEDGYHVMPLFRKQLAEFLPLLFR